MQAKVIGEPDLVRDSNGVIHNINGEDYLAFITKRNTALQHKKRIDDLEKKTEAMDEKLDLILKLLKEKQ